MPLFAALAVTAALASTAPATFTNPLFPGGDPWVTHEDNVYYYSATSCDGHQDICLKSAPTLTGLIDAPWKVVWAPKSPADPNGEEIWAPEIHKVNGHWFIYYCADPNRDNNQHRVFVLRAATSDPMGEYTEGETGLPHGGLARVNDRWAIDPDVFTAADGNLYLTWSCTNYPDSRFPQRICLARLKDPEHLETNPLQISTPLESWEIKGAAIQEGPVGYTRNNKTFITYSASSSWLADTYSVGLLTNDSNELLAPERWAKTGPIFANHGRTYGPGSVVFVPSPDGKQMWNFYHAIERTDCTPAYNCRDIRMQPMHFTESGSPVLGTSLRPRRPHRRPFFRAWRRRTTT